MPLLATCAADAAHVDEGDFEKTNIILRHTDGPLARQTPRMSALGGKNRQKVEP
jgi:hypothetical protein